MLSKGPTREFSKARHARRRELQKACRAAVKGTEWRSNQGVIFAERGGWLLSVQEMTNVSQAGTKARLTIKPMATDPIFWEVIGHPELCNEPLSFRIFGWMTSGSIILGEEDVSEEGRTTAIAHQILELGERILSDIVASWTLDDFLKAFSGTVSPGKKFITRIVTLLAASRFDEAQRLCEDSTSNGWHGGFTSSSGGAFNDMVIRWIEAHRTVENRTA